MCALRNVFFVVIFTAFYLTIVVEGSDDTYEKVYLQQQKNIEDILRYNTTYEKVFLVIQDVFTTTMTDDGIIYDTAEIDEFFGILDALKSFIKDGNQTKNKEEFAKLMNSINLFMLLSAPTIYEAIRFKNIGDLGTLENIFSMVAEYGFNDAWSLIKEKTENDHCAAFDQLLKAVSDTPSAEYIRNAFDPSLCKVSKDTMKKWYQIFDELDPDHRRYVFTQEFDNDLPVFEFVKVVKAYRPSTYDGNFEKFAFSYPVIMALHDAIKSTAYTKEEKDMLRDLASDMVQQFPLSTDHEGRELMTTIKFAQIVSQNPLFLKTFGKLVLLDNDGTFYDLIMWITQKANLEALFADVL